MIDLGWILSKFSYRMFIRDRLAIPHEIAELNLVGILKPLIQAFLVVSHPSRCKRGAKAEKGKVGTNVTGTGPVEGMAFTAFGFVKNLFS